MKKLFIVLALLLSVTVSYSQDTLQRAMAALYTVVVAPVPGGPGGVKGFIVNGFMNDPLGIYTVDSVDVGDIVWDASGNRFEILEINSRGGSTINVDVEALTEAPPVFDTGVGCIQTETGVLPLSFIIGLSDITKQSIANHSRVVDKYDELQYPYMLPGNIFMLTQSITGIDFDTIPIIEELLARIDTANATDLAGIRDTTGNLLDTVANKPTISTMLANRFPFASGTKSLTTNLGYLGRETGRVYIDSLAAFRLPSWTTPGRIVAAKNGDGAYNATLHLPDYYINGAWRNGVVSNGALTPGGVAYIDANGHLAYDAGLVYISGTDRLRVGNGATNTGGSSTLAIFQNSTTIGTGINFYGSSPSDGSAVGITRNAGGALQLHAYGNALSVYATRVGVNSDASSDGASNLKITQDVMGNSSASHTISAIRITGSSVRSTTFDPALRKSLILADPTYNLTSLATEDVGFITYKPTVTSILGNHYGLRLVGTNIKSGFNTEFPTSAIDVVGHVRVRNAADSIATAAYIAAYTPSGNLTRVALSGLTLTTGTLTASPTASELIGVCVDTVSQTSHGFVLGDIIYWTGTAYADFIGTTGDTIIPSGTVVESITANSFSYSVCGVIDNNFSRPDGFYYYTGGGVSLIPDTLKIPHSKVEGSKSTMFPPIPYSEEVSGIELLSITGDTGTTIIYGGDNFDLVEAVRSDELGAETSSTPTTAAKFTIHLVDCTSGVREVDTPATPVAGDWFAVSDSRSNAATNNITIDTSGDKLGGASVDFVMSTNGQFARFTYVNSTIGWIKTN